LGNQSFNARNCSIILMGLAMHSVGDTYAHQYGAFDGCVWKDQPGVNDDIQNIKSRWICIVIDS